jgi:phage repressor protein C with HTH and peptisase S24 domain
MEIIDLLHVMFDQASRIKTLMDEDNLNQQDVADKVERHFSLVSKYLNSKKGISRSFLLLLQDRLGWSADWIDTGKGSKRLSKNEWVANNEQIETGVREDISPYNGKFRGVSDKLNMWWVPAKAEAGFINGFAKRIFPSMIKKGSMPLISGECFGFEIDGFSMFPDFLPGTFIVCTTLEDSSWLRKGKVYVFQTAEGLIIKFFDRIDDGKIFLNSANNNYNPVKPIPVEEVQQLYSIEFKLDKPNY